MYSIFKVFKFQKFIVLAQLLKKEHMLIFANIVKVQYNFLVQDFRLLLFFTKSVDFYLQKPFFLIFFFIIYLLFLGRVVAEKTIKLNTRKLKIWNKNKLKKCKKYCKPQTFFKLF